MTETALLKVQSDILHELDTGLSAAFNTIDQSILFGRLNCIYGISGTALELFKSYLDGKQQVVIINKLLS